MKKLFTLITLLFISSLAFSQITITSTVTNVTCYGLCNGSASVSVSGGTAPYTYWTSNGANAPIISNLCAGQYTIHVLDAASNEDSISINITQPSQLISNVGATPACNGVCSATANVSSFGGTPPYQYLWSNGNVTQQVTNLCPATFTVQTLDAYNCSVQNSVTVISYSINANVTYTNAICGNSCNGEADINVIGGNAPYSFQLLPIGYTGSHPNNLCAGNYTFQATDSNGCIDSQTFTITSPPQIILTVSSTSAPCFGTATGTINVANVSGGNPGYQYNLNGSGYQPSTTFPNVAAGLYVVGVKDANNCTSTQTVQVYQASQLIATTSVTNVTCFGLSNGAASVIVTGGTPTYTYSWTGTGGNSYVSNNLPTGNYGVTILDANGCISTSSVSVSQPTQLIATTTVTNVACFGTATGIVNIIATGGIPPYQHSLAGGSYQSSSIFPNQPPGVQIISVKDGNNCTTTNSAVVTQAPQLFATTTTTNANCSQSNGAVCAIVSGGTSPYNYIWSFGSTTLCGTNIPAGAYTFTVIDINGCITVTTGLVNNISGPLASIASATNATCSQADGALCAITTGGVAPYNYSWSNGATTLCNTNIPVGVYSFSVTDAAGCISSVVGQVNNIGGPTVSITNQTNVTCFGLCDGSAITSVTAGTAPYTYSWSNGSTIPNATNLCAGLYSVSITDFFGCIGTASLNISQPQPLSIAITAANNTCFGTCNGTASVVAMGGTPGYAFVWNTAPSQSGQTINNICLGNWSCVVTDMNGCSGTASVNIGQTAPLITNITKNDVTCGGNCDGQAFANVSGGSGAFTYLWLPILQTGNTANGLCSGQYTLNVTDMNGCITTNTFVIANQGVNAITNATLTTAVINETCLFTNDGGIDLTISGTNPGPFTYQWSNGATTQDITNIPTGSYNVTVFDASLNCLSISSNVSATGTNCGTISGNVFIDNNSDCIKNSGDNNSNNTQIIANPGNRIGYTNFNGDYIFYNLPFATYTITSSTTANMLATCVTTLNTTLNSVTPNSINNNFAKEYIPITQPDLQVSAYSNGIVPGFVCYVNYYISNLNNIPATGLFKAVLPSAFIPNITTGNPNTYSISGDTVIWNFTNNITWEPTGYNYFTIDFTTPLNTPLGSTIYELACGHNQL
jgi:hypothetical protein